MDSPSQTYMKWPLTLCDIITFIVNFQTLLGNKVSILKMKENSNSGTHSMPLLLITAADCMTFKDKSQVVNNSNKLTNELKKLARMWVIFCGRAFWCTTTFIK